MDERSTKRVVSREDCIAAFHEEVEEVIVALRAAIRPNRRTPFMNQIKAELGWGHGDSWVLTRLMWLVDQGEVSVKLVPRGSTMSLGYKLTLQDD